MIIAKITTLTFASSSRKCDSDDNRITSVLKKNCQFWTLVMNILQILASYLWLDIEIMKHKRNYTDHDKNDDGDGFGKDDDNDDTW